MKFLIIFILVMVTHVLYAQSENTFNIDSLWSTNSFDRIIELVDSIGINNISGEDRYLYSLSFAQKGKFDKSLINLYSLKEELNDSSNLYFNCLYSIGSIERENSDPKKSLTCFKELLRRDSLQYNIYPEIIQCYFKLEDYSGAKNYQDFLYKAYDEKKLPKNLNYLYVYDSFSVDSFYVRCSEAFPRLGTAETEGCFSKTFAYVKKHYGNLLFVLETVKIHQLKPSDQKYLLNRRYYDNDWNLLSSESFWEYTFTDPIDYAELKKSIISFLRKNPVPTSISKYKRK